MRYSLLSRFEGCLLGAAVAERLGAGYEENAIDLQKLAWFGVGSKNLSRSVSTSRGIAIQKAAAEKLIKEGFVQKSFWQSLAEKENIDTVDVVLGTLPLALYLHEQELKKKLSVQEACLNLPNGEFTQQVVLALGYGISLALQEKLVKKVLIGETVERLQQDLIGDGVLANQLSRIQSSPEDDSGLETLLRVVGRDSVKGQKPSTGEFLGQTVPVAIAFDSFLRYSEDFRLCVIRALRAGKSPRLAALCAGALCGAYVGVAGIPVAWTQALSALELGVEEIEVRQMALELFAAWSGVYQNQGSMIEAGRFGAVAAPLLLRRR
ncbi:ADP-ribosylglycohydrolase family protein [Ancylothrix sp. C2]|uniref:ADP-ribosylglycohydrolase family protein n=1 Tax=Ancylothrix sp. D3o TaxID=2953691 RepID=UPI0021BA587F|nr:ADP-ribosylglycohydrolase family protein [Ancylothrix sp. D3o]MCT7948913.1 ADP-ribosylglycohydrolase family protein [Ancylothrix sp. D3o]